MQGTRRKANEISGVYDRLMKTIGDLTENAKQEIQEILRKNEDS